jgi:hypothetical protein
MLLSFQSLLGAVNPVPNANHDRDKLTLFSGKQQIMACVVAFFLTFVIHFWLQGLFAAPVQAVSDKIFPGAKTVISMQGSALLAIIVVCAVSIPSLISAALVFCLSNVGGLTLGRAVLIWLAVVTAVSFAWGIVAGRYQLV